MTKEDEQIIIPKPIVIGIRDRLINLTKIQRVNGRIQGALDYTHQQLLDEAEIITHYILTQEEKRTKNESKRKRLGMP